jgi:hypothetical protein
MKHAIALSVAACCLSFAVNAEESKVNLRDPSIWQSKTPDETDKQNPCEVFSGSVCPGYQESKTDIQKEQQRREDNRRYKDRETGKWRD